VHQKKFLHNFVSEIMKRPHFYELLRIMQYGFHEETRSISKIDPLALKLVQVCTNWAANEGVLG